MLSIIASVRNSRVSARREFTDLVKNKSFQLLIRICHFLTASPQGDHNIVENINKLIKDLLSFTWFVFCIVFLICAAALLSCTALVFARANLNYANLFLTV